jgi:hypothetical protein
MRITADPATSVVRLDEAGLDALVTAAADDGGVAEEVDGGVPADVLDDVLAIPGMPQALAAAHDPLVQVRIDVAGRAGRQSHWAWLDLEGCALLLAVHEDERQLLATTPQLFAAAVARVTRIGPRRTGPRQERRMPADVVEDLFHADEMRRTSAFAVAGVERAWTLSVTWGSGERQLAVIDGDEGLFRVEPGQEADGEWAVSPVTATDLWRALTTVLPGDEELAADPAPQAVSG